MRTAPRAIRATASHSRSCSSGRSASRTAAASRGVRQLERALGDDRPGVDPLVDEVDGDAEHLHAVVERLLDHAHAREGGQQRGMHVDHAIREAGEEAGLEQRHVAGEHDQLDVAAGEEVGDRGVARRAVGVRGERELGGRHARARRALERGRPRLVGGDRHDLDAVAAVKSVEDGLEVRAGAGREHADPHTTSSFGNRPPVERSVPAASSASTRASTAGPVRCDHAP